ncbi:VgrG-related protein [Streptomyces wuyuanensis]|uniref:VgrG-related protein n=1 Tax=Streptomyces wuyuanensis TaxID=1196353 RepID=UPI00341886D3
MSERFYTAKPLIDIGSPIPEVWDERLAEAFVDTSAGLPAEAYLRFRDPEHRMLGSLKAQIGTAVRVSAVTARDRSRTRVFAGEVVALETESSAVEGTYTVVRAMDLGHRLLRGRHVTSYADTTVADVVSKIARRAGMTCGPIQADSARIPHLAQPNLSDWEMLQHLAAERGLIVSVEDTKLCLRKPAAAQTAPSPRTGAAASPFVLQHGVNLISLRAGLSSTGQVSKVEVRGWDPVAKQPLSHHEPATSSDRLQVGATPGSASKAFGSDSTLLVTGRPYTTAHDVQNAARALAADTAAAFADVEAVVVGAPQLRAGAAVALAGVGAPFEGKYTVFSSRHVFDRDGYRTRIRVTTLAFAPVPPAPPLSTRGVAVAVVADTKEPHEGQHGWVRLRLPWLGPDYVTDWVRTVQCGGVGGGGVFPVELEDEVLVGFEHGRLDRPYVLGGLYNGKDEPSDHAGIKLYDPSTGKANRRSFVSRDTDRIEILTPSEGSQGIHLSTGKENDLYTVLMDRSKKVITVTAGADENKVSVHLDHSKKELTLDAGPEGTLNLRGAHVKIQPNEASNGDESTFEMIGHSIVLDAGQDGTFAAHGKTMNLGSDKTSAFTIATGTGDNKVSITTKNINTPEDVNWTTKGMKFTVAGGSAFSAERGGSKVTLKDDGVTVAGTKVDIN